MMSIQLYGVYWIKELMTLKPENPMDADFKSNLNIVGTIELSHDAALHFIFCGGPTCKLASTRNRSVSEQLIILALKTQCVYLCYFVVFM